MHSNFRFATADSLSAVSIRNVASRTGEIMVLYLPPFYQWITSASLNAYTVPIQWPNVVTCMVRDNHLRDYTAAIYSISRIGVHGCAPPVKQRSHCTFASVRSQLRFSSRRQHDVVAITIATRLILPAFSSLPC